MALVRADRLDDAGAFMAQYGGERRGQLPGAHRHVGVADAAGRDAHQHFVGAQRVQHHRLKDERLIGCAADGGLSGGGLGRGWSCETVLLPAALFAPKS